MFCAERQHHESKKADRFLRCVAAAICVGMPVASAAKAQEAHARFLLTSAEVVGAMQKRQLPTQGVQVRLSVPMTAAVRNPLLDILAIAPLNAHDIRLRISCSDRSDCLPFFAEASYPEAMNFQALHLGSGDRAAAINPLSSATKPVAEALPASTSDHAAVSGKPLLVRSGSPAVLDFDVDRVHVRLDVLCLESGATGDKIRVTTRDRKKVYVAEIVAPNILKGTLTP